jgi:hypothetical protein
MKSHPGLDNLRWRRKAGLFDVDDLLHERMDDAASGERTHEPQGATPVVVAKPDKYK